VCSGVASCTGGLCYERLGTGWTTPHTTTGGFLNTYAFGQLITIPTTLTITALGVHNATSVGTFVMGLYTVSAGLPNTLLTQSAQYGLTAGDQEVPVSIRVVAGTYFVVAQASASSPSWTWGSGSPGTYFYSMIGAYSGALPSPMPLPMPGSQSGIAMSGYIDFYLVGYQ
jgi:hypothetical protein